MHNFGVYWRSLRSRIMVFDAPLAIIIFLILSCGVVTLYSAGIDFPAGLKISCAISSCHLSLCG
jgi:rod shape determining protein RodA